MHKYRLVARLLSGTLIRQVPLCHPFNFLGENCFSWHFSICGWKVLHSHNTHLTMDTGNSFNTWQKLTSLYIHVHAKQKKRSDRKEKQIHSCCVHIETNITFQLQNKQFIQCRLNPVHQWVSTVYRISNPSGLESSSPLLSLSLSLSLSLPLSPSSTPLSHSHYIDWGNKHAKQEMLESLALRLQMYNPNKRSKILVVTMLWSDQVLCISCHDDGVLPTCSK